MCVEQVPEDYRECLKLIIVKFHLLDAGDKEVLGLTHRSDAKEVAT